MKRLTIDVARQTDAWSYPCLASCQPRLSHRSPVFITAAQILLLATITARRCASAVYAAVL